MNLGIFIFFVALFVLFGYLIYLDYKKIDNDKKLIKKDEYDKLINFIKKISSFFKTCKKKINQLLKYIFSKLKKIYSKILSSKAIKILIDQYQKAEEKSKRYIKNLKDKKIRNEALQIIARTKKALKILDDRLNIAQQKEITELVTKLEYDLEMMNIEKIVQSKENLKYLNTSLNIFGDSKRLKKNIKNEALKLILKTEKALKILDNDLKKIQKKSIEKLIYNLEVTLDLDNLKEIRKSIENLEKCIDDFNIFAYAEEIKEVKRKKESSKKVEKNTNVLDTIVLISAFIIFLICLFVFFGNIFNPSRNIFSSSSLGFMILGIISLIFIFMKLAKVLDSNIEEKDKGVINQKVLHIYKVDKTLDNFTYEIEKKMFESKQCKTIFSRELYFFYEREIKFSIENKDFKSYNEYLSLIISNQKQEPELGFFTLLLGLLISSFFDYRIDTLNLIINGFGQLIFYSSIFAIIFTNPGIYKNNEFIDFVLKDPSAFSGLNLQVENKVKELNKKDIKKNSLKEKLEILDNLKANSTITEEEYIRKRQLIIDEFEI